MKLGSLVKLKRNHYSLGLRMDDGLPYLLQHKDLMVLLSVGHIKGFCKVLLLAEKTPGVLTVNVAVLEPVEEDENRHD
jgi:hypothetical protein